MHFCRWQKSIEPHLELRITFPKISPLSIHHSPVHRCNLLWKGALKLSSQYSLYTPENKVDINQMFMRVWGARLRGSQLGPRVTCIMAWSILQCPRILLLDLLGCGIVIVLFVFVPLSVFITNRFILSLIVNICDSFNFHLHLYLEFKGAVTLSFCLL